LQITLNGDAHELAAPLTVSELLAQLQIDARRVAVEHNLVVLKREAYDRTTVHEGDEVEIVNFVGGGSGIRNWSGNLELTIRD
jgi:thiazole synthase